MARGLLNPKNAVEGGGGFKEGMVRVDRACFKVYQNKAREGQEALAPVLALIWGVTRLDPDNHEPLKNDDGGDQKEELQMSLGGKSLNQAHPGKADSADDEEVEDLKAEVGTEGPTVFLTNPTFKLNSKSGCSQLMESLRTAGFKEEYLDRVWAPDFVGCIFHMKNLVSKDTMTGSDGKEYTINYKVVDKIIRASYEKKGKETSQETRQETKATAAGAGGASGRNDEAEAVMATILTKLSEDLAGQTLTRKALSTRITGLLQANGVAPKLHVPALTLSKDNAWLAGHGAAYDYEFDAEKNTLTFGK